MSSYDSASPQQDVVVWDRRIAPPIVYEAEYGIFPLESVLFTVEVKSVLNADALQDADAAARKVASMLYRPSPEGTTIEGVVPHLVAFSSDLSTSSELDRYTSLLDGHEPGERALCVVSKGFWFWADGQWKTWASEFVGDELLNMIIGMTNTYSRVAGSRRPPDLRNYIHSV